MPEITNEKKGYYRRRIADRSIQIGKWIAEVNGWLQYIGDDSRYEFSIKKPKIKKDIDKS